MTGSAGHSVLLKRVTVLTAALLLAACAGQGPQPVEPVDLPVPVVVEPPEQTDAVVVVPQPVPDESLIVEPPRLPEVAIVLSSRQPAYEGVAIALSEHLNNYTLYDLSDKSQPPVTAFRFIEDSDTSAVVAIGLRAAVSAKSMSKVPVVFSQVFNYQDHDLISGNSRGISTLPPLDLQIAAWKKIDPSLRSIGAIVGKGHEKLIAEAELAAATHGIDLQIRIANSDRETLYLFNRLAGSIDGFWLFPDNRVLSGSVLQEMMSYAARHGVQVAVFNESLLSMGAAISSAAIDSDIAEAIVQVLQQVATDGIDSVPDVTPLSVVRITTNDELLQKLKIEKSRVDDPEALVSAK